MSHKKEILTAVGTISVAIAVGFVMQSGETAKERYGVQKREVSLTEDTAKPIDVNETEKASELAETIGDESSDARMLLEVEDIKLTSAVEKIDVPMIEMPIQDTLVQRVSYPEPEDLPQLPSDPAPQIADCEVSAVAHAMPGALVALDFDAPCAQNEQVSLHHNGMIFTDTTDDQGQLSVVVPALSQEAVFILALRNGDGAVAQTTVPDLADFDRIVLHWRGNAGFELHAREFGADYGEDGHVWSGAPKDTSEIDPGKGGFFVRLGDARTTDPLMNEIYTFPTGKSAESGVVKMTVEIEVNKENCGRDIEAQTVELSKGADTLVRDLTLTVPDCDAIGSFMVLNNLVSDLKVARN